jgi:amino acid adenylation domain-containing protein
VCRGVLEELDAAIVLSLEEAEQLSTGPEEIGGEEAISSAALSENGNRPVMTPDTELEISMIVGSKAPMSFGQTRIWFPYEYLENKTAYNCTTTYQLRGPLDVHRLEEALKTVIRRNSSFCTFFFTDPKTGDPYQEVQETSSFQLRKVPSGLLAESSMQIEEEKRLVAQHVYDLGRGDTFIATLLRHTDDPPGVHTIIFGYHHIIMDGVSWQLFLQDLDRCYSTDYSQNNRRLPPVSQYVDFTLVQREAVDSHISMDHRKFWKEELVDPPAPLPILPFAKSSTRKSLTRYDNIEIMVDLEKDLVSKIKKCSTAARVTTFHFYLSVLQVLLHRFLQVDDFVIGIVDAGRGNKAFLDTIGFLIDLLPLRFNLAGKNGDAVFSELLKSTRSKAYSAMGHSGVPFDVILQDVNPPTSTVSPPLFQVVMNYRLGVLGQKTIGDVNLDWSTYEDAKHPFDFILTVDENDGGAFLTLSMQEYMFDRAGGDLFLSTYIHFLNTFANESSLKIKDCALFNNQDLETAIALGKGPVNETSLVDNTLSLLIDKFVASQPDAIAIKEGISSRSITYQQMADRVNEIANALLDEGVSVGTHVAMLVNPVADAICAILAIMRIGAVYIPLDVRNSTERLTAIVAQSRAVFIIFHDGTCDQFSAILSQIPDPLSLRSVNISSAAVKNASSVANRSTANSPAFIMFTSGSTGQPKGVILKHSNFLIHVAAASKEMNLRSGREVILQQSAFGYDASLAQIFYALANGGCLVMTSNRSDMADIAALMQKEKVTFMLATPSEYSVLFQYGWEILETCTDWRVVMCGGEAFPSNLKQSFHNLNLPELNVWNAYGPSEISVASSFGAVPYDANALLQDSAAKVPIGRAIANYAVYILDPESVQPLPVGWTGEICVGGPAVSAGYLYNEGLTRSRFIPDNISHISADGWTTLYRTGDQGRMLPNGSIAYLGRITGNSQIKLRGIRIELEDVSSSILQTSAGVISNAVVCTWGEGQEQLLVGFVVFSLHQIPEDLEGYLRGLISSLPLPSYMRPAVLVPMESLPRNASGKLDRRALQNISLPEILNHGDDDDITLTDTETKLKQIWMDIVALSKIKIQIRKNSDFFSVGGNSLLLLRLQREIRHSFKKEIPLSELFRNSNLGTLAQRIDNNNIDVDSLQIDWDAEIVSSPNLSKFISHPTTRGGGPLEIILTGSTGFLGNCILKQLSAHPEVSRIHSIAVRPKGQGTARRSKIQQASDKVITYTGDLSLLSLGLSEADQNTVFANASAIIHCGADVSFMQTYTSLRNANVQSTQELIRMSLARRRYIPFHFVSTAGVVHLSGEDSYNETSVAMHRPPTDGSDGYVASKWASEVFLEACNRDFGIPVSIHRPSSIVGPDAPSMDIMNNILRFSKLMKILPQVTGWVGFMDLIDVESVAANIINTVVDVYHRHTSTVQYFHESGQTVVPVESVKEYLEKEEGGVSFQTQELGRWIESARKHGMDQLVAEFLTTMHASGQGPSMPLLITSRIYDNASQS